MSRFMRLNKLVGRYLIFSSPLVLFLMVYGAVMSRIGKAPPIFSSSWAKIAWDVLGIHFLFWLLVLFYFLLVLVLSTSTRDVVLTRLARIKERDEREELIVGQAARTSWLSMLALSVFLLLLSGLQIQVQELAKPRGKGPRRSLSIGYGFSFLDRCPSPKTQKEKRILFSFSMGISKTMILLLLVFWQILTFHLFSRRVARQC